MIVLTLIAGASAFTVPAKFGFCTQRNSQAELMACRNSQNLNGWPPISRRALVLAGPLVMLPPGKKSWAAADNDAAKLLAGYETLVDLIDNWPRYAGDKEEVKGDSVRRQIGTVGNKSPLVGIRKVLLRMDVDLELMEEFGEKLTSIDANAYASIFAASGKKRGYMFMEDALKDCKRLKTVYQQILESLDIPFD